VATSIKISNIALYSEVCAASRTVLDKLTLMDKYVFGGKRDI
jgi:hypothetical protein